MSILLIGANGGVGKHLVNQFKDSDEAFTAGVRKEDQVESLKAEGVDSLLIDVEADDIDTLKEKIKGFDKVIFLLVLVVALVQIKQ